MAREQAERGSETTTGAAPSQTGMSVAVVHQLIKLMSSSDIEEITIESPAEGMHLTLRKPAPAVASTTAAADVDFDGFDAVDGASETTSGQPARSEIGAPLVGIFRAGMKPGAKPLATVGQVVREGQVIGAIEALQVYNEVEAPEAGTIREILVEDGQPVEYGQPLFVIEPHSA